VICSKAFGAAIMFLVLYHELIIEKGGVQLLINYVQKSWNIIYGLVQEFQDKSNNFDLSHLELLIVHVYFFTFSVEALYS